MANVWSFNTTVRNPERMENFLRALRDMEGTNFDETGQAQFFGLQIKKRLYKPTKGKLQEQDLINAVYDDTAEDIPDAIVERILDKFTGAVDAAGRGRTAAGILNRFGLCVALASKGPVVITKLGKKWLDNEISDEELFTKFFLKWQYPNPIETGYSEFNIKPFLGIIDLISKVNSLWKEQGHDPVGLSKEEYMLFAPTLVNHNQIDQYAEELIEYRNQVRTKTGIDKSNYQKQFARQRVANIFGSSHNSQTALNDLRDYTDSSVRYFRMSGFISTRGSDRYIDIARDKAIQAERLVQSFSSEAEHFETDEEYLNYLNDINVPALPWDNEADLEKISENLKELVETESDSPELKELATKEVAAIGELRPKEKVEELQELVNEIRIQKLRELRYDTEKLKGYIARLEALRDRNTETVTARPSLDFEWFASLSLMVLNDALKIAPSYKLGDDGIPTGFRANTSDIECFYKSFGMSVEVTLLLGRDQWISEGQPVMRHFREFENKIKSESSYCLFIAPLIHRDTLNTFWNSLKHGFEGKKQNIIPLSLEQFVDVLKICCEKIEQNNFTHETLKELLQSIAQATDSHNNSSEWVEEIPQLIQAWA